MASIKNTKTLVPVLLLAALALAGCTEKGESGEPIDFVFTEMKYQQVQCEDNPWGANTADAIASHYDVEAIDVEEKDDGMSYTTVCGGKSSTWVHAGISGNMTKMEADGWVEVIE